MTTRVLSSRLRPRIGRSRALSLPWSASIRLFAYCSALWNTPGMSSATTTRRAQRPVGRDFDRLTVSDGRGREEPSGGPSVAPRRNVDINDLAVLVDGSVDVAPPAGDLDVGFVDIPAVADRVAARSGRVDQQRGEALHPPEHGDVIDLDSTLGQQFLDVAVRQAVP